MRKIIEDFKPQGGKHCITTALKQVLEYYNYPISEELIFGIGSGLSFCYINLENSPMISGRTKPFEFEKILGERLNIEINCKASGKYKNAFDKTIKQLNANNPVLIYADMPYLNYLNLGENNHFGGHAIVIFGYDDENQVFYVSDRDNTDNKIRTPKGFIAEDFHLVDYSQIEKARSSNFRPFPAKNKYLDINIVNPTLLTQDIIFEAITETSENMLNAPAQLLGLNGIKKFSKEILKWDKFNDDKLKIAGITNYFQINADGGTGGGIFRKMYGEFLIQSGELLNLDELNNLGNEYIDIAIEWDKIGDLMWNLSETLDRTLLKKMSTSISQLYEKETDIWIRLKSVAQIFKEDDL